MVRFLTEGLYVWEMDWPPDNRSSHAVVNLSTRGGLLYHMKRMPTDLIFPRTTTTEDFEMARFVTEGIYIWEMDWPPDNRSRHAVVDPIDFRFPRATATEDFEMTQVLTKGFDVMKMYWPSEIRVSHAVMDVDTRGVLCIR
ncbi:hypothetical protein J6590_036250 [Homalodisca vitripennis]|nr:hypothetical protein J6590_036250 [Homalodisca vitripennis]